MGRFETAGRKFIEAFNRHDADATAKLYANDCVVHDPLYPEPLVGRNAVKEDNANFFRAFPDIRFEIVEILDRGDVGSAEMKMTGTNTGPLTTPMGEIPPTGKRIELWGAVYARLGAQDLVVEERRYYDTASFMRALGVTPEPQVAATH